RRRGGPGGRRPTAVAEGRSRVSRGKAVSDEGADGLGESPSVLRVSAESQRFATAVARVPATCGELLQGVEAQGPVLVSLPVERGGTVAVTLLEASCLRGEHEPPTA